MRDLRMGIMIFLMVIGPMAPAHVGNHAQKKGSEDLGEGNPDNTTTTTACIDTAAATFQYSDFGGTENAIVASDKDGNLQVTKPLGTKVDGSNHRHTPATTEVTLVPVDVSGNFAQFNIRNDIYNEVLGTATIEVLDDESGVLTFYDHEGYVVNEGMLTVKKDDGVTIVPTGISTSGVSHGTVNTRAVLFGVDCAVVGAVAGVVAAGTGLVALGVALASDDDDDDDDDDGCNGRYGWHTHTTTHCHGRYGTHTHTLHHCH